MNPRFPLYIPSKGRSQYMMTSRALKEMNLPHFLIVEPKEITAYQKAIEEMRIPATILTLDFDYKKNYELCDNEGLTKSTGPGPARNFAWDHALRAGYEFHWVMDDNIREFKRLNLNERVRITSPVFFRAMEDFVLRYENVAMAGPNYAMFLPDRVKHPPLIFNTRIYSCNLIRNDLKFRWRGRYNEDTILSLDVLKAGWCTIQFNAFLQNKMQTQKMKGGNSDEFYFAKGGKKKGEAYAKEGTAEKSQMIKNVHPDVTDIVWKFKRIHHHIDYRPFRKNILRYRHDYVPPPQAVNNYGIALVHKKKPTTDDSLVEENPAT